MDFGIISALKNKLQELEKTCNAFDIKQLTGLEDDDNTLAEILNIGICEYLMYLISSDEYIDKREIDMFNFITDYYVSDADEMRNLIINSGSYLGANNFRPPWIISIMIRVENALNSEAKYAKYSVVDEFVEFFKLLGLTMVNIDSEMDENERIDFLDFNRIIENYVDDNIIYK